MSSRFAATMTALAIVVGHAALASAAYIDITRPGDPVELISGFNQGDGNDGPPPASETEIHAIDDVGQKYLNFLDLSSGIAVTPSANPDFLPVQGIRFYTANDAVDRDPASFQLSGSNDGIDGPWTHIASGNIALPDDRNPGGNAVEIPPTGNMDAWHQTIKFDNTQGYEHFQVIFPTLKNAATANSMQIAEIELLVENVPEPSSFLVLGLGSLGIAALRRRRS